MWSGKGIYILRGSRKDDLLQDGEYIAPRPFEEGGMLCRYVWYSKFYCKGKKVKLFLCYTN
jgi:hypothetical protein